MNEKIICPVCGQTEFECWGDYDDCLVCGWTNDGLQYNDHDYVHGFNDKSVNQLKKEWKEKSK